MARSFMCQLSIYTLNMTHKIVHFGSKLCRNSHTRVCNIFLYAIKGMRREQIVRDTFKNIKLPSHVLHNLLPAKVDHQFNSRDKYSYLLPVARTQRYANSFIPYCIRKRYWYGIMSDTIIFWLFFSVQYDDYYYFSACTNLELCFAYTIGLLCSWLFSMWRHCICIM